MKASRRGFTIIELLLTIIVISTGLVGIMALFENATRGAMQADLNVIAANLAHEKLEQIVLAKWRDGYATQNSTIYPNESFTGDLSVYSRNTTVMEVSSADFSTPQEGSGYKRVEVAVNWGSGAAQQVSIPTVLSSY